MSSTRLDYDQKFIQEDNKSNERYFSYMIHGDRSKQLSAHLHENVRNTHLESKLWNLHQNTVHPVPGSLDYNIHTNSNDIQVHFQERLMPKNTRNEARLYYENKKNTTTSNELPGNALNTSVQPSNLANDISLNTINFHH